MVKMAIRSQASEALCPGKKNALPTGRDPAMDIIRCVALFYVISVHFFLHIRFYDCAISGGKMYLQTLLCTTFMSCVPLFVMLSGYLTQGKKLSLSYYKRLLKTLATYLLASAACTLFENNYLGARISLLHFFLRVVDFSLTPYVWYMEMYIGLFLLTPFLNVLYHGLSSKRQKQALLLTMLFLTALPGIGNIYCFGLAGWWKTPSISDAYQKILPAWWTGIWPLTYYYLGCYLREYKMKMPPALNLLLYAAFAIIFGTFNFYRSHGKPFIGGAWVECGSLPMVIMTFLLFTFLTNAGKVKSPGAAKLLEKLSGLCLGGYLVSYIFDSLFYPVLNNRIPDIPDRLVAYPIAVLSVFACSLVLSFALQLIWRMVCALAIYFRSVFRIRS